MKYLIFLLSILLTSIILPQNIDFQSAKNIKLFADFLFCEKDYLRAIDEYEKYLAFGKNDSVSFKIAYGYLEMGNYKNAIERFSGINSSSPFFESSKIEILKTYFLSEDFSNLVLDSDSIVKTGNQFARNELKLKNCTLLLMENLPPKNQILIPFNHQEKIKISDFYDKKINPPYKSELMAAVLSTIIPGSGKIYTQNYGDGVTAFIVTGLFGYLAYTNFNHNHDFRGWIFTGVASGFYAGNIYGSIASAQIFNAKVNFEFVKGVKLFLEDNNYFTPTYDFCK